MWFLDFYKDVYQSIQAGAAKNYGTVGLIVGIVLVVLLIVANWRIFTKAGEKGWKCIIPFYNDYTLYKFTWSKTAFWVELICAVVFFIANGICVGLLNGPTSENVGMTLLFAIISFASNLALIVIYIVSRVKLSVAFGHGGFWAFALIILPNIFTLILGFGTSEYIGIEGKKARK